MTEEQRVELMSAIRAKLLEGLHKHDIPLHMHEGLIAYVLTGRPTGHFLMAILTNDLRDAVSRADEENQPRIHEYVRFLYNYAPVGCWGSPEHYAAWVTQRGMSRL